MFLHFRCLFEKDKIVFSFMLCGEIMRQSCQISDGEWNFFLRGSAGVDKVRISSTNVVLNKPNLFFL